MELTRLLAGADKSGDCIAAALTASARSKACNFHRKMRPDFTHILKDFYFKSRTKKLLPTANNHRPANP